MTDVTRIDTLELHRPIALAGQTRGVAMRTAAKEDGRVGAAGVGMRAADELEVSELATYLSKLSAMPPVRTELVETVRRQIAAGTYDTPEKMDAAMEELLRDLVG
jgi:anti-sigma28 factor (negative regulator of flagellin synthesis)